MKTLALFLLALSAGFLPADPVVPKVGDDLGTITTTDGKTYAAAKLISVEPDGITVLDDSGGGKIAFQKLSPDLQKKFGYDPQKADTYAQQQAYETKIAQLEEDNAKLRAELARYKGAIAQSQADSAITPSRNGFIYFFNHLLNQAGPVAGTMFSGKDSPYRGQTVNQLYELAQNQWGALSYDEKVAYEQRAKIYGRGPDPNTTIAALSAGGQQQPGGDSANQGGPPAAEPLPPLTTTETDMQTGDTKVIVH